MSIIVNLQFTYHILVLFSIFSFSLAQETSPESLVGKVILLAFEGQSAPLELLHEFQPAGFLFYASNLASTEQIRSLNQTLQEVASYPLVLAIDQEGGPFNSYRVDKATLFPGAMSLAAGSDVNLARSVAEATGQELSYAGFNMNFAPVADVQSEPDNPIIGIRAFAGDADTVAQYAHAFMEGLHSAGVIAVAKHFPGHGDTALDSHLALPNVSKELGDLEALELKPFQTLIDNDVAAIMSAHIVVEALDENHPATLSANLITGLLKEHMGFTGLVVSDFMDMRAIRDHFGAGEAAVKAVQAGVDLLLLGPSLDTQREVQQALLGALASGELNQEQLQQSALKVQALLQALPTPTEAPDYQAHALLADKAALAGATLSFNDGILPLDSGMKTLLISAEQNQYGNIAHLADFMQAGSNVQRLKVNSPPTEQDIDLVKQEAAQAELVVLAIDHWAGPFPTSWTELSQSIDAQKLVLVSLGSPYLLEHLAVSPRAYLMVYGFREANVKAAAHILMDPSLASGRLPVAVR